jgi:hypothetical protein
MSDGMYLMMRSAGLHELVAFLDPHQTHLRFVLFNEAVYGVEFD